VDVDDVLAATSESFLVLVEEMFGKRLRVEDIRHFDLAKSFGLDAADHERLMDAVHEPEVLEGMRPVAGAAQVLGAWSDAGYQIAIMTGRPPDCLDLTRRWLRRHGLNHGSVECVDKYGRFDGGTELDALRGMRFELAVEDSPEMAGFLARHGSRIVALMDRPWNRTLPPLAESERARIVRVRDWGEIGSRFGRP
jgi:uncharacterized HAD superfamily protein